jgi:uncharacterized delta-60 repeat protein
MSNRIVLFKLLIPLSILLTLIFPLSGVTLAADGNTPATPVTPLDTGDLDLAFGGFGNGGIVSLPDMDAEAFALQSDEKIVVVGENAGQIVVARFLQDGSLDRDFGENGSGATTIQVAGDHPCGYAGRTDFHRCGVTIQPDGKILVVGDIETAGKENFLVMRLTEDGGLDPAFGFVQTDFKGNRDHANDVAIQLIDGEVKIVVTGTASDDDLFDDDNYFATARYNLDGSPDTSFSDDGKVTTRVGEAGVFGESAWNYARDIFIQPDNNKIVVAGRATETAVDSNLQFGVVRYLENGDLDDTFSGDGIKLVGFGGHDEARGISLLPDGKLAVVGRADESADKLAVALLNADGSLDDGFAGDGTIEIDRSSTEEESLMAVASQPDGKIVAVGYAGDKLVLMRVKTDGTLNTSFVGDGILDSHDGFGVDLIIQPDAKFLVLLQKRMMRFNPNGDLDDSGMTITGFTNHHDQAYATAVQDDGKIVVVGEVDTKGVYDKEVALVRYNPDGSRDLSFGEQGMLLAGFYTGEDGGRSVAVQPDGKIVVAGRSKSSDFDFLIYRFEPNGDKDPSLMKFVDFGIGDDFAEQVLIQPDGKIVVAGFADNATLLVDPDRVGFALLRFNPDGKLDQNFGTQGKVLTDVGDGSSARVRSAALQPDGKIVVAGTHKSTFVVARYNTDGSVDDSFGTNGLVRIEEPNVVIPNSTDTQAVGISANSVVAAKAVGILSNGDIVVSGAVDGDFGLVFLGTNGGNCTSCPFMSPGTHYSLLVDFGEAEAAYGMTIQPDNKILVVGNSTTDPDSFKIARIKAKGSVFFPGFDLDPAFGDGGQATVDVANLDFARAVALTGDSIVVAGYSGNGNDRDFSVVQLENDIDVSPEPDPPLPEPPDPDPPMPVDTVKTIFIPIVVR